jgi:hypothetical protein
MKDFTVGWRSRFFPLSGITSSSHSPGLLPNTSFLHCAFIQCRLSFIFSLQCHTQLVQTSEMWRKNCFQLHSIHLSIKEMKCVPYWLKSRASKERYTECVWRHHVTSYIATGQETQISVYDHKWGISLYKATLMNITPGKSGVQENICRD